MYPIDVHTGAVGSPVQVEGKVHDVVYDGTRLWVALTRDGTVQAIDPDTGRVSQPIRVGSQPEALAVDRIHRRLWVANTRDHTVQAIDLDKGVPVGDPIAVDLGFMDFAFAGTRLWVAYVGSIQAIDPVTLEASPLIPLIGLPCALAVDGTRLWLLLCNTDDSAVQAFDTSTRKLSKPIPVRNTTGEIEFDGTRLWVSNQTDDQVQYFIPLK